MRSFFQRHPFAVEAVFVNSLVVTFAAPGKSLEKLIPECLQLDLFQESWGFVAVAMVQTRALRPKGFPEFLGNDFVLVTDRYS